MSLLITGLVVVSFYAYHSVAGKDARSICDKIRQDQINQFKQLQNNLFCLIAVRRAYANRRDEAKLRKFVVPRFAVKEVSGMCVFVTWS